MKVHGVVKYVDPKDCLRRIKLKPTDDQIEYLEDSARAINCLFVRLLTICECVDDKYRGHRKRRVATDMYLLSQVPDIKEHYPETRNAWSASQGRLVYKVLQRNFDRVTLMKNMDRRVNYEYYKAVKRLSEIYEGQGVCDMTGFQIPIDLNSNIHDITQTGSAELSKTIAKVGKRPVIVRTIEGTKLYVPKMKKGIKVATNGLHDLRFLADIERGEAFAYIENYKDKYYLTIYDRKGNRFMPTTHMPKAVKLNQIEAREYYANYLANKDAIKQRQEEYEDRMQDYGGKKKMDRFTIRRKTSNDPESCLDNAFNSNKNTVTDEPKKSKLDKDFYDQIEKSKHVARDPDGFIDLKWRSGMYYINNKITERKQMAKFGPKFLDKEFTIAGTKYTVVSHDK